LTKGPKAAIECPEEIPCNPCEASCPQKAITLGVPITNIPKLDDAKCIGCTLCISACPGLAIFVVNPDYSEIEATVAFPYEYLPMPERGDSVIAVDRTGAPVCEAKVLTVARPPRNDRTAVITVTVPKGKETEVRSIARQSVPERSSVPSSICADGEPRDLQSPLAQDRNVSVRNGPGTSTGCGAAEMDDDTIVCRCEEVTAHDIKRAIAEGATDLTGVKRRTRAGMGLCQGRTCESLIARILSSELRIGTAGILAASARPPAVPVTFGVLAGEPRE